LALAIVVNLTHSKHMVGVLTVVAVDFTTPFKPQLSTLHSRYERRKASTCTCKTSSTSRQRYQQQQYKHHAHINTPSSLLPLNVTSNQSNNPLMNAKLYQKKESPKCV